jgi:hypothetical protein
MIPNLPRSGNYLVDMYDDWLDSQEEEENDTERY